MQVFTEEINAGGEQVSLQSYIIGNSQEIDTGRQRPAIIIIPGGGFTMTSDRESEPIALRMLSYGYQAFVLRYSVAPVSYPAALLQLATTVQTVRQNAQRWHVDPNAIILAGFSAGGHLAADLCIEWNGELLASHGFEAAAIRPNGLMLGYSVITSGEYAHRGSIDNLLCARKHDPELLDTVSLEKHVNADMPPVFLFHSMTDAAVPVENGLMFVAALHKVGVEVEAHFYPSGPHGVSLANRETVDKSGVTIERCEQSWPELFHRWVVERFEGAVPLNPSSLV